MQPEGAEQLARLWTQAQPSVGAFIFSIVRDFHLTEDLLQEVAVVALREFEKYDIQRPFLPWVLVIARNAALMALRTKNRSRNELLNEDLIDEIQMTFHKDSDRLDAMRRALKLCLAKQKNRMLEVLKWRYAHDLQPQAIASRMGMSSGAVRILLHRSRAALRECIRQNLGLT
jgi:RNA polymerase sigma-70 factor, ECF subfamily